MATSKAKKHKQNQRHSSRVFLLPAVLGILLILSGSIYIWHQKTKYSFAEIPAERLNKAISLPIAIGIPAINISLPIDEGQVAGNVWQVSDTHANHLSSSASPGEGGNIVIYGHNKPKILGKLDLVQIGDAITLTSGTGQKYTYSVTKKIVVSPNQVEVIKSTGEPLLTVYTCTGFLDSKRLVIQAKPI